MESPPTARWDLPKDFEIDDVLLDDGEENITSAGSIESWTPDYSERRKLRPYIAVTIVVVWGIGIVASAVRAFIVGDALIVVPPAIITLPLMTVLKFYFRNGQKEKGYGHDKSSR